MKRIGVLACLVAAATSVGGLVVTTVPAVAVVTAPCVAVTAATRTVGTIQRVTATRIRVNGHTDYWSPGHGWTPLNPASYRVAVQKRQPNGTWATFNSVVPQKTWQITAGAGVYRLAYLRVCTQPYGASSGAAVRIAAPAVNPKPAPKPKPTGGSGTYYPNCAAARAAGAAPLHRGEPGYRPGLDGDGDGVACE